MAVAKGYRFANPVSGKFLYQKAGSNIYNMCKWE